MGNVFTEKAVDEGGDMLVDSNDGGGEGVKLKQIYQHKHHLPMFFLHEEYPCKFFELVEMWIVGKGMYVGSVSGLEGLVGPWSKCPDALTFLFLFYWI